MFGERNRQDNTFSNKWSRNIKASDHFQVLKSKNIIFVDEKMKIRRKKNFTTQ